MEISLIKMLSFKIVCLSVGIIDLWTRYVFEVDDCPVLCRNLLVPWLLYSLDAICNHLLVLPSCGNKNFARQLPNVP